MSTYNVATGFQASGDLARLEEFLDKTLPELELLGGITDADCSAALATGQVHFTGFIDSDSFDEAVKTFADTVHAAIDAAGPGISGLQFSLRSIEVEVMPPVDTVAA